MRTGSKLAGLVLASVLVSVEADAHKYPTDSYGCHNNTALNVYECHTGTFAGKSWPNPGGKTRMLVEAATPPPPPVPDRPSPFRTSVPFGTTLSWSRVPDFEGQIVQYVVFWRQVPTAGGTVSTWFGPVQVGSDLRVVFASVQVGATYEAYAQSIAGDKRSEPSESILWTVQ